MYKLKDIISSGGTNPKINKAIDRYELSKDEKKDIISTIKTNVPQSGGSGGGLKVEYLDLTNVKSDTMPLAALLGTFGYCAKVEAGGLKKIVSLNALLAELGGQNVLTLPFYACQINFDAIYGVNKDGTYVKNKDVILTLGLSQSDVDSIPRLTEEEFYTI